MEVYILHSPQVQQSLCCCKRFTISSTTISLSLSFLHLFLLFLPSPHSPPSLSFSHTSVFFQASGKEYITHLRLSFIFFLETVHTLNTSFLYTVSQIVDLHTHYLPPHKKKVPRLTTGVLSFSNNPFSLIRK